MPKKWEKKAWWIGFIFKKWNERKCDRKKKDVRRWCLQTSFWRLIVRALYHRGCVLTYILPSIHSCIPSFHSRCLPLCVCVCGSVNYDNCSHGCDFCTHAAEHTLPDRDDQCEWHRSSAGKWSRSLASFRHFGCLTERMHNVVVGWLSECDNKSIVYIHVAVLDWLGYVVVGCQLQHIMRHYTRTQWKIITNTQSACMILIDSLSFFFIHMNHDFLTLNMVYFVND